MLIPDIGYIFTVFRVPPKQWRTRAIAKGSATARGGENYEFRSKTTHGGADGR